MELSVLKHMVLTFLGSQGPTQGPQHRKSKFSVPPPPQLPKINRAIPERGLFGVHSWGHGVHEEGLFEKFLVEVQESRTRDI